MQAYHRKFGPTGLLPPAKSWGLHTQISTVVTSAQCACAECAADPYTSIKSGKREQCVEHGHERADRKDLCTSHMWQLRDANHVDHRAYITDRGVVGVFSSVTGIIMAENARVEVQRSKKRGTESMWVQAAGVEDPTNNMTTSLDIPDHKMGKKQPKGKSEDRKWYLEK